MRSAKLQSSCPKSAFDKKEHFAILAAYDVFGMTRSLTFSVLLLLLSSAACAEKRDAQAEPDLSTQSSPPLSDDPINYSVRTILTDYLRHGRRSGPWDSSATNGLGAFARGRVRRDEIELSQALISLGKAVAQGCDDPIVLYSLAHLRYRTADKATPPQAAEWVRAAEGLEASRYADSRKAWGAMRAAQALKAIATNTPPEVLRWRDKVLQFNRLALAENDLPPEEGYGLLKAHLDILRRNQSQRTYAFEQLWPLLTKKEPRSAEAWTSRADCMISYAWAARGNGYADTVKSKDWKLMEERLAIAEEALDKAWALGGTEQTALVALTLERGQGKGRARMEEFFKRAMSINPKSYEACSRKLTYLYPRWYGSREAMLEFGQECVSSKLWGGKVPLVMLDVHDELAKELYPYESERHHYWTRQEVWQPTRHYFPPKETALFLPLSAVGYRQRTAAQPRPDRLRLFRRRATVRKDGSRG
jgi:hypothetical protein